MNPIDFFSGKIKLLPLCANRNLLLIASLPQTVQN